MIISKEIREKLRETRKSYSRWMLVLLAAWFMSGAGCSKDAGGSENQTETAGKTMTADPLVGGPFPTILISKAQFTYRTDAQGKKKPEPGAAKLVLLRKTEAGWQESVIEDPASNVFHKAIPFDFGSDDRGILTIGGTAAALRFWRWRDNGWSVETLWQPRFGGRWDRMRDVEIGDVNGDGRPDMVIATHDQGVVGLVQRGPDGWLTSEVDRSPNTFVHEVEIGDIDGDGQLEFFTTPSKPNSGSLVSQPGSVAMYRWDGNTFKRSTVDSYPATHAKEILAVDLDGDGKSTLMVAVEGQTQRRGGSLSLVKPVEIKAYEYDGGQFKSETVVTLKDTQCRFLVPGDVDGDDRLDIVAASMRSGIWLLRLDERNRWYKTLIDSDSSSFEHATMVCDLDSDGKNEIVVASDVQGELRCYSWNGTGFDKQVLAKLPSTEIAFCLSLGQF